MKALQWLIPEKVKVERFVYETTPDEVFTNHHYISKVFKTLYIDLSMIEDEDKMLEFVHRFSGDYGFYVKMPEWSNVYDSRLESFQDTMNYLSRILQFSGNLKGLVLEMKEFKNKKMMAYFGLKEVFLKRTMGVLNRKGVNLYLSNGLVMREQFGFTVSDLIMLKKEVPELKLTLNLHNSVLSGAKFMDVYKKEKTLGGLVKNFGMVLLSGTTKEGDETVAASTLDKYSIEDYQGFIKQFPGLIVYKGDLGSVLNLHEKMINGKPGTV